MNPKFFIGRENEIEQFVRVMDALVQNSTQSEPYANTILVYGVGGMGKTYLCKKFGEIARMKYPKVVQMHVDWGTKEGSTLTPIELLDILCDQLKDEFPKEINSYLNVKKDIKRTQEEINRLIERDKESIDSSKPIVSSAAAVVSGQPYIVPLVEVGLGLLGKVLGIKDENRLRQRWGVSEDKLLLYKDPESALANILLECIKTITTKREKQILMVLDMCELIRRSEAWLMNHFLVPLVDNNRSVVLVYSGRDNTYTLRTVTIDGQTKRVYGFGDKLISHRPIAIDMKLFSEVDIRKYLKERLEQDVPEELVRFVQTFARGVPYAVDLLTNAMCNIGIKSTLHHFQDEEFQKQLECSVSNEQVIKNVAERFLFYCFETDENKTDLHKIYTLAILQDVNPELLREIWQVQNPAVTLQMLQGKYAFFIEDGKLHDVVQEFLVEYLLKTQSLRDGSAKEIAHKALPTYQKIYEIECEEEPIWQERFSEPLWRKAVLKFMNCLTWSDRSQAVNFFIKRGIELLLLDTSFVRTLKKPLDKMLEWEPVRGKQRHQVNALMEAVDDFYWSLFSEKVLSLCQQALDEWKLDPVHGSILMLLKGRMQYHQTDYEAALKTLLQCDETTLEKSIKDKLAEALDFVGQSFCLDKENLFFFSEKALRAFEKVVQLNDRKCSYLHHVAVMLRQSNEAEKALPYYSRALELDAQGAYVWNGQGLAFDDLGRYDDAIAAYQKAIEINPKYTYPYVGLGNVYQELDRYDDAIASYQKAIEIDPKYAPYVGLGNVYQELDRYDDAIASYQKGLEIDPNNIDAYCDLAQLYCELGEFEKAEEQCEKAAKIDSRHYYLLNTIGIVRAWQGKFDEAIEYYEILIQMSIPTFGPPYNNMGDAYVELDQYDKAIECYKKAIEHRSKKAHTGLGYVYLVLGELDKAETILREAIQIQRNNRGGPKIYLALTYLYQGKLEQARQFFTEATEVPEYTIESQFNKVIAFAGLQKFDEALQLLQQITDNFTFNPLRVKEGLKDLKLLASAPGQPEGIQTFLEKARKQLGIT